MPNPKELNRHILPSKLNLLLDQAAARYSRAYNKIKDITNKGADIQEMNDILLKHVLEIDKQHRLTLKYHP